MKNFLSNLWSLLVGSQRNDVEFDRRLTVGSPSGFTINWTLKLVSVLAILLTVGVGNMWGATKSFNPSSDKGSITTNGTSSGDSFTKDGFTISSSNGVLGNGSNYRVYQDGIFSISSSVGTITAISFTFSSDSYTGGLSSSYTGLSTTSWSATASSQARITAISITYTASSPCTITWHVNGNTTTAGSPTTSSTTGSKVTALPTAPASAACDGSKVFVGWTETPIVGTTNTRPADLFTTAAGAPTLTQATTNYYAVFADEEEEESSKSYSFTISYSDFNSDSYGANDGSHSSTATATDASGETMSVSWYSSNVMRGTGTNSSKMQFRSTPGYIYNTTDLNSITNVSVSGGSNVTTYQNSTSNPTSNGTPKKYFRVGRSSGTGYASSITVTFAKTITVTTYSNYATTCCTQLGQPATLTLDKTAYTITATWTATSGGHEDGYSVQLYNSSSVAEGSPVAIDCSSDCELEHEFTGLSANTTYYVGVTPTYSGAGDYCTSGTEKKVSVKTDQVYQVTYNGNNKTSGTVPTDANYYEAGATVTVKTNSGTLVRSGHTFNGWNTANDGSGEHYAESGSATFTMPAENVTLYAEWVTKKDYYIDRMHGNWDGEHTVEVNGVVYNCYLREGAGYTRPTLTDNEGGSNSCVTGHSHFLGWVLDSKIGAQGQLLTGYTIYAGGSSGTSSTDGTIYWAVWAEDEE